MQSRSFTLSPEYCSDNGPSRPCSPIPNIVIPTKPPGKPKRRERQPVIDELPYTAPPNPPKIKVIDFDQTSPERVRAFLFHKYLALTPKIISRSNLLNLFVWRLKPARSLCRASRSGWRRTHPNYRILLRRQGRGVSWSNQSSTTSVP